MTDIEFPGTKVVFPIVLDDRWNREALERYMNTTRSKAVYLPCNIDYLARNNGLQGGATEALEKLMGSSWVIVVDLFMMLSPLTSSPGSLCLASDSIWLVLSWYQSVNAMVRLETYRLRHSPDRSPVSSSRAEDESVTDLHP